MNRNETTQAHVEAVAEEIRAIMGRRNIGKRALSQASGVPEHTLYRYLSGERDIPFSTMLALSAALGVDVGDIAARAVAAVASRNLE